MTTNPLTPTAFLLQRLADDEAAALGTSGCTCGPLAPYNSHEWSCPRNAQNRPHDPARVLAQVAALRAVVEEFLDAENTLQGMEEEGDWEAAACWSERKSALRPVILALCQPYADHPNFDPAWLAS